MDGEATSPIKEMPECWNDEKRMNWLLAPFRRKEINPVDWESKMKFWHSVIEKWCLEKSRACFSVRQIQREFRRRGKTPVCIDTVVQHLAGSGAVRPKDEFLSLDPKQSWASWAVDSLVRSPISWSVSKFKNYWSPPDEAVDPDTQYVHMVFLKEKGEELCSMTENLNENLISYKEISELLCKNGEEMSEETVHCIVHYLVLEGLATTETVNSTKLVKLLRKSRAGSREITQADLAVFKLQQNRAVLEKNIEHLEQEKEKCVEEARAHLAKGMRQSAKSCLRKKRQLEKCIEKRAVTLDNLESLLTSLRNTESDTKVLDAYKVGLAALKGTFKSSGLSEEGVFETMAQLQEMNDIQDEIQMAMSQPAVSGADADLEEELAQILSDSPADKSIELPDVPDNNLDMSPMIKKVKKPAPSEAVAS